ncbi:MAG TPA: hypothetical protein VNX18_12885 [Bryobacteraceae bacterium]|jgi:hypothetical protein|nr:hypothetical protein [Bryobacteraceae bacterium]
MTLEQASAAALAASTSGDLETLKHALAGRAEAISELASTAPSEELAARLRNAIGAGEFVHRDLCTLTGQIAALRDALGAGYIADPAIDLRG